jgi:hypothetical protein
MDIELAINHIVISGTVVRLEWLEGVLVPSSECGNQHVIHRAAIEITATLLLLVAKTIFLRC